MINFRFSSLAMMKEDVASFSLHWKEARADFQFQPEKRSFFVFSSLLSLFGDRVEFLFLAQSNSGKETSLQRSERRE
jgi:hypothetical protein